ncbi:hypothetical protein RP20_CCG011623 [Aedes albopictus]|nr:hypothetical protein RP20_CCG011623 [Aedes albopictus]
MKLFHFLVIILVVVAGCLESARSVRVIFRKSLRSSNDNIAHVLRSPNATSCPQGQKVDRRGTCRLSVDF